MTAIQVPDRWEQLLSELPAAPRAVMVVGGNDSGKTTFCRWLADRLAQAGAHTWLVDADVGQARLGPPATVTCGRSSGAGVRGEVTFFVGDVSPARRPASHLDAFCRALAAAEAAGAERLVVDTTGWVGGLDAELHKRAKAGLLGEAHIVVMAPARKLLAFARMWRGLPCFPSIGVPPSSAVRPRSAATRRANREAGFQAALQDAVETQFDLRHVACSGAPELSARLPRIEPGRLLGLNDTEGRLLGLGILISLDSQAARLACLCSVQAAGAAEIQFGALRVAPDGSHTLTHSMSEAERP